MISLVPIGSEPSENVGDSVDLSQLRDGALASREEGTEDFIPAFLVTPANAVPPEEARY